MGDRGICHCGACKYIRLRQARPSWEWSDVVLAMGASQPVAYCPRCGARLSFDADGGPVVEAREEAIVRAVQAERERCAKAVCDRCDQGRSVKWDRTLQSWVHDFSRCHASAIWGPPAKEVDHAE